MIKRNSAGWLRNVMLFISGVINSIEELEEKRLRFDCRPDETGNEFNESFLWLKYDKIATANIII